jgi:hypothetical protein
MQVFTIPAALERKYKGSGHALAASVDGQLVDLIYVHDVCPGFYSGDAAQLPALVAGDQLGPTVRQLQALGSVHVGMCSCWEFIEL